MNGWNYATTWETMAREVPDREAVICGDRRITFGELDHRADRLAHVLAADGIGAGDAVAISLTNRPEYLETFFAALKLGAAPVNLNYQYVAAELAHVLADCAAAAVVFHVDATDRVAEAVAGLRRPDPVVAVGRRRVRTGARGRARRPGPPPAAAVGRRPAVPLHRRDHRSAEGRRLAGRGLLPAGMGSRASGHRTARPLDRDAQPESAPRPSCPPHRLVHATALGMATATLSGGGTVVLRDDQRLDAAELWRLVTASGWR